MVNDGVACSGISWCHFNIIMKLIQVWLMFTVFHTEVSYMYSELKESYQDMYTQAKGRRRWAILRY